MDLKGNETLERKADDDEPFAALAFKIMTDPHVGKLTYFRVVQRHASTRAARSSTRRTGNKERVGRLLAHARQPPRGPRRACYAGDIVAGIGLKNTQHRRHAVRPDAPDRARGSSSSPSP